MSGKYWHVLSVELQWWSFFWPTIHARRLHGTRHKRANALVILRLGSKSSNLMVTLNRALSSILRSIHFSVLCPDWRHKQSFVAGDQGELRYRKCVGGSIRRSQVQLTRNSACRATFVGYTHSYHAMVFPIFILTLLPAWNFREWNDIRIYSQGESFRTFHKTVLKAWNNLTWYFRCT